MKHFCVNHKKWLAMELFNWKPGPIRMWYGESIRGLSRMSSKSPWIVPEAPLKINRAPGNIQGNLDSSGLPEKNLRFPCTVCYLTSWWTRWRLISLASRFLLKRLFRRRSKKTSLLRVTGLCEGNPPVTGGYPSQRASNAEYVFIWWRHHVKISGKSE